MGADLNSRRERTAARDAALRRIGLWTTVLALGSAGGTAAVVVAAGAPARAVQVDSAGVDPPSAGEDSGAAAGQDPGADAGRPAAAPGSGGQVDAAPNGQPPPVVSSGS